MRAWLNLVTCPCLAFCLCGISRLVGMSSEGEESLAGKLFHFISSKGLGYGNEPIHPSLSLMTDGNIWAAVSVACM